MSEKETFNSSSFRSLFTPKILYLLPAQLRALRFITANLTFFHMRPSIADNPNAISPIPKKCIAVNDSFRKSEPSSIAEMGISIVTNNRLVAPANSKILK